MLKIQNECALEEPSKITYFWNENGKVVFKFYFDSLYLPDDLNLSGEKRSERIKNLFTNQNVYEFQDDFNIIELNTEEGWIKVIPTDQNFKVVDSYKDLKKKKEDDEKEESVFLAGKRLNENVALAEGMILREGDTQVQGETKIDTSGSGAEIKDQERSGLADTNKNKDTTKKQTTVLKGKSIFICTVGNPFGKSIEVLSKAFEDNKEQTEYDTLIVIPTYGKEFGIAKGGDFGFKESVREALRKKIFDQNWGLNIFSLEHKESREILQQSSKNDGDDVLFFCAKSQQQEIQSILSNDYKINLQNFFSIEKFHEKDTNKVEFLEKLKELPAVLSADYIEGKKNIAINIVEAFMADVEKIKEAAEEDSKKPNKKNNDNNDKNKKNDETNTQDNKNGEQDKTNSTENEQGSKPAEGGQADDGSMGEPLEQESIFLSPYRKHRKLVEKKQSETYKLETNADWDFYFSKEIGEKWVTAKKEYTKSYQSRPQNVDSEEFKTYFYLGMIAYAYATSNKVLELDKPYIKNEKSMEQQLIDNPKPKKQSDTQRGREPGSEDLKLNLDIGSFGTDEQKNTNKEGGLIVNDANYGGSGQVKTKNIKAPDLSVKKGKDNITSKDPEAPKSFPGAALPFNLKIWALVGMDNSKIKEDGDLEKIGSKIKK